MEIMTASGAAHVNKRSPYGKWLQGWISAGGRLMVIEQGFGAALQHKRDE